MIIKLDVDLSQYTTVRIGGIADKFYIPESREELIGLIEELGIEHVHILGAGSNLLINDQKRFPHVIYMSRMDKSIRHLGNGRFYVGASVMIPELINSVNQQGYGGIEYMYAIPATLGGAVVMNAGVGSTKQSISQQIVCVECLYQGSIVELPVDKCQFEYRNSIFQNRPDYIVVGAVLQLKGICPSEAERVKSERMTYASQTQDRSGYNFGTIFVQANARLLRISALLHGWRKKGIRFSTKKETNL